MDRIINDEELRMSLSIEKRNIELLSSSNLTSLSIELDMNNRPDYNADLLSSYIQSHLLVE